MPDRKITIAGHPVGLKKTHKKQECLSIKGSLPACWQKVKHLQFDHGMTFIGGFRGGAPGTPGTQFFRFDIQILWNVATSGVHVPPPMRSTPPMGNPGSATDLDLLYDLDLRCVKPNFNWCPSGQMSIFNV